MARHLSISTLGFGLAGLLAACSNAPGDGGFIPPAGGAPDLAMQQQAPPDLAMAKATPDLALPNQAGYPPGPYGNAVGATVENLKFKGYFTGQATTGLASAAPNQYAEVSLDMLRQVKGGKYLLLFMGGFT